MAKHSRTGGTHNSIISEQNESFNNIFTTQWHRHCMNFLGGFFVWENANDEGLICKSLKELTLFSHNFMALLLLSVCLSIGYSRLNFWHCALVICQLSKWFRISELVFVGGMRREHPCFRRFFVWPVRVICSNTETARLVNSKLPVFGFKSLLCMTLQTQVGSLPQNFQF